MTDEEFVLRSDNRERAAAGRGDFHKKRWGGRYVRLPSDYMTRKERNAMNGEVRTYNPRTIMPWAQIREMPTDLQKEHLQWLMDNGGTCQSIGQVAGTSDHTIGYWCKKLGVKTPGRGGHHPERLDHWDAFLEAQGGKIGGVDAMKPHEAVKLPAQEEKPTEAKEMAVAAVQTSEATPGALRLCGEAGAVLQKAFDLIGGGRYEISVEWRPI